MATQSDVHIVSKANIADHKVIQLPVSSSEPLQDGHTRVRTVLIGLSSNNLSYALLGSVRNWWDAYPVPIALPKPYDNREQYGICPAWGYGEVMESKISGIEPGMLFWGFWPTSRDPIDLRLEPADARGHWIETSEHRESLMNLYQRYMLKESSAGLKSLDSSTIEGMAWEAACRPIWEAGYLLNRAVFSSASIHPADDGQWNESDTDLTPTVVISLSASGKTARGFTDGLINNRPAGTGPLGLLAITSISKSDFIPKASFPTRTVSYESMTGVETLTWIERQKPRKIVIADFGARGDSLTRLLDAVENHFNNNVKVVVIGVGGNVNMHTPEQLGQWAQRTTSLTNRVQMNASAMRDAMMKRNGAEVYFSDLQKAWESFIKGESASDLKLKMGFDVQGNDGLEGGWTRLCEGAFTSDVALAYTF